MAFDGDYIQYQRWDQFHFYDTFSIALPFVGETKSLAPADLWKLEEIRLHFSTAFASAEYLKIRISSIKGSAFNIVILSQSLNGVEDLRVHFSQPLLLFSDDQLIFYISNVSHANVGGLEVIGWAVRG